MKNFCPLPFGHINVRTNGDMEICCDHQNQSQDRYNVNTHRVDEWRNSAYRREVQEYFKNDQRHPGCERCWRREDQNTGSLRTAMQKEYKILGISNTKVDQLVAVEAQVGNLCNLKCLMCDETQSSVIMQENTKLGINVYNQKDFAWQDSGYETLASIINSDPKVIILRGGEPLYNKKIKKLLSEFPEHKAQKVLIQLITNATAWDDEWKEILSRFKSVRMMLSIDATNDCYEYIRFPAEWQLVEQNVKSMLECKNIRPLIHCTVQNLNILYLDQLIKWATNLGVYLEFNMLVYPKHLRPINLAPKLISTAINRLNLVKHLCTPNLVDQNLFSIIELLEKALSEPQDMQNWQEFVELIQIRDQNRGNSYQTILVD